MEEQDQITTSYYDSNPETKITSQHKNSLKNPAAIDVNIISIPIQNNPEQKNTESNSFFIKQNTNLDNNIRKASCDINLFECENPHNQISDKDSIVKANLNLSRNENDNFSRRNDEDRIYLPESESSDILTESQERVKNTIETPQYKYLGETLNGKRDGFGICEFTNGKIYIGMFKNDLREGLAKIMHPNGDKESAEFSNDRISGYYECVRREEKNLISIKTFMHKKKYSEFIIYENMLTEKNSEKVTEEKQNHNLEGKEGININRNVIIYEGEPSQDENCKISFGMLTIKKDDQKKIFIGNVLNYIIECGVGLFYKENSIFYGEINKNKQIINYIENYSNESGCFLGFLKDSKKNGIGISFLKDGRVCIGEFEEDYKKGPIFIFNNNTKQSVKMELYILGFKTKTVEKMDTIKNYLLLNYPEFYKILKIDFDKLINKLIPQINEENIFSSKLIEGFKSELTNE